MSRYNSLLKIIDLFRPETIVETGTWKGHNAVRMLTMAKQYCERPRYIGYDLFEEANENTDAEEFNGKVDGRPSLDGALNKITRKCPWAFVNLIKGNTRKTLGTPVVADLAFIDGGHSLETIEHDYRKLSGSKVIVFDDYYSPDAEGRMPDITKVGCNLLVNERPHVIIRSNDAVKGGGIVNLAVVFGS